jgi:hypothetical protein
LFVDELAAQVSDHFDYGSGADDEAALPSPSSSFY